VKLRTLVFVLAIASHASAEEEPRPEEKGSAPARGFVAGGISHSSVFHVDSQGFRGEAGISADLAKYVGASGGLALDIGKTDARLGTGSVSLFGSLDLLLWRFRLGAGPRLTYFWMDRAPSTSLAPLDATGFGLRGALTFDLVPLGSSRALFISGAADIDLLRGSFFAFGHETPAWRIGGMAGVRF
jgi:hypothetical protein